MLNNLLAKLAPRKTREARALTELATSRYDAGDLEQAEDNCRRALALDGNHHAAHALLAKITLPGHGYHDILRQLHAHLRPRTYVEIGVRHGNSIVLAGEGTLAIGVDPAPKIRHRLGARTKIFRATSDHFFSHHDVDAELDGLPIDLAFIDGMHKFEFALRDFINIEKHSSSTSTILVHDCYPLDETTAQRDRATDFWSGDVWRLILALKKYRTDLDVRTIGTEPTGLGCIRNLDPSSTVLADNVDRIVAEFLAMPYHVLDADKDRLLSLFPNKWPEIEALTSRSATPIG